MMRVFYRLMKICLLALSLLFISMPLSAQEVTCSATAPAQVEVGQAFEYKLSLNANPTKIVSINFNNFKVIGGPNGQTYSQSSTINGQRTQSTTYIYTYVL